MSEENQKFSIIAVMFYGGLTVFCAGIEGVSFYSGLGIGLAVQGLLLAKREGAW